MKHFLNINNSLILDNPDNLIRPDVNHRGEPVSMISTRSYSLIGEGTFLEWLKSIFTMPDEDIEILCGEDALQYLRFQRYIICYLIFVMVICISVILPINFQGTLQVRSSIKYTGKILRILTPPAPIRGCFFTT